MQRWQRFSLFWLSLSQAALYAENFQIEGIRLGMPLKEAMTALKAHNPALRVVPDSIHYPGLPAALTYGINAVGGGEGFYFLLSMPPSEPKVIKLSRVIHYSQEMLPQQNTVAAGLAHLYGPLSFDTTPAALSLGTRDIFWVDDEQGRRLHERPTPRCLGQSTFYMNGHAPGSKRFDPTSVRLPPAAARLRIEEGFTNRLDPIAAPCAKYTMVHARLFPARVMGVMVPNLVEYVVVLIASGPMDRRATIATHELWANRVRAAGGN